MTKIQFHRPHNVPPIGLLDGTYIMEDCNAGQMMQTASVDVGTVTPSPVTLAPGDEVCITRPGGFGDLLFLRPILTKLMQMDIRPTVCCADYFSRPVHDYPRVDYPMRWDHYLEWDKHIFLENLIEVSPEARTRHVIDILADKIGVTLTDEEKRIQFATTPKEKEWAADHYPRGDRRRIGIQLKTSSPVRNYPPDLLVKVMAQLERDGWEILCLGRFNEVRVEETKQVRWVGKHNPDFGESCAVLETCDVVLAPDSALCHVAGAFGLPTLALYGPFLWQTRTAYAPSIRAINGTARCAPCWWHSRGSPFPEDGPCRRTGRCEALADITPERVLRELEKIAS